MKPLSDPMNLSADVEKEKASTRETLDLLTWKPKLALSEFRLDFKTVHSKKKPRRNGAKSRGGMRKSARHKVSSAVWCEMLVKIAQCGRLEVPISCEQF